MFLEINITSNYSVVITMNSPIYYINRYGKYGYKRIKYRYENIGVIISTSGFYKFECNKDKYQDFVHTGTIDLYTNSFNAANLSVNRLSYEYGSAGIHISSFGVSLRSAKYILVVIVSLTCMENCSLFSLLVQEVLLSLD
jgi:hypothetical protein